ncbi:hypothetical protein ACF07S_33415 [Streptomyces sp. NPDC016640]|uniref:hypothetical protein n=1 Tax=Streptomyces sp. NPDC016640 TaxID=3364969 RepID=UPI0036F6C70F
MTTPPGTHVVFTLRPLQAPAASEAHALATSVKFRDPGDHAVEVAGVSWRQADRPYLTHAATFTPAVEAAIAPGSAQSASRDYQRRYDAEGFLRPAARTGALPFSHRAAQIQAMAGRLLRGRTSRAQTPGPEPSAARPSAPQPQPPRHPASGPGRRV